MPGPNLLDDPEKRRRAVRALLVLSPFAFLFAYWLAWIQGARSQDALLIGAVMVAMCLSSALVIHLMGARSRWALILVQLVLALAGRR